MAQRGQCPSDQLDIRTRYDQYPRPFSAGAVAQLGERDVRNVEVSGSIPLGSTKFFTAIELGITLGA